MSMSEPGTAFGTVFRPEPDPVTANGGGADRLAQLRALPRRRRPGMIALAVALVGVGILGSAALYQNLNHRVPVLLVTAAVPAGSVIRAADLTTASVAAGPGVQTIPARQERQVIGLVAATGLRPGTLLAAADVTAAAPPAAGQVLVPVAIKPSGLPASGLTAGDSVLVVPAPGAGSGSGSTAQAMTTPVAGVVMAVTASPEADGLDVVDLLVASASGAGLAEQAASGEIALIVTKEVG